MTDDANLILEQLRMMRGDMSSMRSDMQQDFTRVHQRIDTLETEVRGLNYIVTVGSLLGDVKDLKDRVGSLENGKGSSEP